MEVTNSLDGVNSHWTMYSIHGQDKIQDKGPYKGRSTEDFQYQRVIMLCGCNNVNTPTTIESREQTMAIAQ